MTNDKFLKPEFKSYIDPISYYNRYKADDAVNLFNSCHKRNKTGVNLFIEDGKTKGGEVVVKDGLFYTYEFEVLKLPANEILTPFQVFLILHSGGNLQAAIMEIERKYMNRGIPYIRVGVDYFKIIKKPDRYNILREELKRWSKTELQTDYNKRICEIVPKFDDFTIEPDNINYKDVIKTKHNIYKNLYSKFDHKLKKGEWRWSKILLEHVFGDQYELGLKYMQCLYMLPKQILPILVVASKERTTGKTTFINWCNQIFGANATIINPSDLTSDFNGAYASCNVIAIEETMLDKNTSIEKLKSLTTAKYISVNRKNVDHYKIPFFGKVIIATNNVTTFARVDDEEIRFWARPLKTVTHHNTDIETNLVSEIPAFLAHLKTLPPIEIKSRMVFTPDEIKNDALIDVKTASKPTLYKELCINIIDYFDTSNKSELAMTLSDIKGIWFANNHNYSKSYIKDILTDHFNQPKKIPSIWYTPLNGSEYTGKKKGRCYVFTKDSIDENDWNNDENDTELPY